MISRFCLTRFHESWNDNSSCIPDFSSGNGYGNLTGHGIGYAGGHAYGPRADGGVGEGHYINGSGYIGNMPFSVTGEDSRRTERVFLCAGCIGGYECSIHGGRL